MNIIDLTKCDDEVVIYINNLQKELFKQKQINKNAIKYLKEHCIDDEFYLNLSNKEKCIFDVLFILETGDDSLCLK